MIGHCAVPSVARLRYTPPMTIDALWTDENQAAFEQARRALAEDDLAEVLLAIEGADPATRASTLSRLALWTEDLQRFPLQVTPEIQTAILRRVLAEKGGLTGELDAYYDPQSCHLSAVVAQGSGMPILVTSIWMIVGRNAGVPIEGVGLPGHFIARVGGEDGQLVDPFSDGRPLTKEVCKALVKRLSNGELPWKDSYLETTETPDICARVLRNLQICHERAQHPIERYRAARMAAKLFPERGVFQVLHAQAAEVIGVLPMALTLYRDICDRFAGQKVASYAQSRLDELSGDAPLVH